VTLHNLTDALEVTLTERHPNPSSTQTAGVRMYQQDRKVAATARQSHARVQPLQFATPRSKSFHDGAQTLLMESAEALESTSLVEEKEDTEARRAGVKARAAAAELENAFEDCHCSVYAHQLALRARSRADGMALGEEIDATLEGTTPSSFRTLSSPAKAVVTRKLLTLGAELLGPDEVSVKQLETKLQLAQQAEGAYQQELGEKIDASTRLEQGRDAARRAYQAARLVLEAALVMEGRQEDVNQLIPPYYRINKAPRRATDPNQPVGEDEVELDGLDEVEVLESEPTA